MVYGSEWLSNPESWPTDTVHESSQASKAEAKMVRGVLSVAVDETNEIYAVLQRHAVCRELCVWSHG